MSAALVPENASVSVAGSAKSPRIVSASASFGASCGVRVIKRRRWPARANNSAVRRAIRPEAPVMRIIGSPHKRRSP